MEKYGLQGCCLDWFKSYLLDRKLCVSCKTTDTGTENKSEWYAVDCGTPQGSMLSLLIFLIFCNDLHINLVFLSCIQFADDTTLYISHQNLDYIKFCLEHDLGILQDWFRANKLTLNIGKSVFILFGKHNNQTLSIRLGNEIIPQVKFTKFLGLWIDENLNWRKHTSKLLLKLKSNINLLKTGRNCLSQHALKVVYFAQIHSNLSYGIGIWGSLMPKEMLTKLQQVQNACIRILNGKHASPEQNNILTVDQLVSLELCKLWHKNTLGLLPKNLMCTMNTDQHNKNLQK